MRVKAVAELTETNNYLSFIKIIVTDPISSQDMCNIVDTSNDIIISTITIDG